MAVCVVEGCEREGNVPGAGKGMCRPHYNQRDREFVACKVEGCERNANAPGTAQGLCTFHYRRLNRYGDPLATPVRTPKPKPPCSVDGCERLARRFRWGRPDAPILCDEHDRRFIQYGDPLGGGWQHRSGGPCAIEGCERPSKTMGMCALHYGRHVVHGDALWLPKPRRRVNPDGYVIVGGLNGNVRGKGKLEHRAVMEQIIGRPLARHENVHHLNGQRGDNRPENLELWSKSQPHGQRAVDKLAWAEQMVALYGPLDDAGLI